MAKEKEKTFTEFMPFDSPEVQETLKKKAEAEFPTLTTAEGKVKLHRQIKWVPVSYRGAEFEVPVVKATNEKGEEMQITLSALFGKEEKFVPNQTNGSYEKGKSYDIPNLVEWKQELQSKASLRNAAVMAAITDGMEITILNLWGQFEGSDKRPFNLTVATR